MADKNIRFILEDELTKWRSNLKDLEEYEKWLDEEQAERGEPKQLDLIDYINSL